MATTSQSSPSRSVSRSPERDPKGRNFVLGMLDSLLEKKNDKLTGDVSFVNVSVQWFGSSVFWRCSESKGDTAENMLCLELFFAKLFFLVELFRTVLLVASRHHFHCDQYVGKIYMT